MCGFFRPEDQMFYRAFEPPSAALIERARAVESSMDGARVPDEAWELFFGSACGVIEAGHFERMFTARRSAAAYLAIQASARRRARPLSLFRCIPD